MPKNVPTTVQLCSFHMLARSYSKSFKLGFSSTWTKNFQMYKLGLEKGLGSWRKQGSSKTSTSASLTMLKPFTAWVTTDWKILKKMGITDQLTCLWETNMQVKKQQLEPDLEQWTASKLGKKHKAVHCHPAYLTYMQSTSCEMAGWMNHKLESRLLGENQQPRIYRWYHSNGKKRRRTKEILDESGRKEWKIWLEIQH